MRGTPSQGGFYLFIVAFFVGIFSIGLFPSFFAQFAGAAPLTGADKDLTIYYYDQFPNADGDYTEDTVDANDAGGSGDVQWLMAGGEGEAAVMGHSTSTFDRIYFDVSSATFMDGQQSFQYWDGSAWTSLTVTSNTAPFMSTGTNYISFSPPTDWTKTSVSGTSAYYVRLLSGDGNTMASVDQISLRAANLPTTTVSLVTAQQSGTGAVSLSFNVGDNDYDSSTRLKFEYKAGSTCTTGGTATGTIDSGFIFGTNSGAISVDNADANGYQINNIDTSSGGEGIFAQWNSASDVPAADGVYCLYFTPNDGTYDGVTVTTTVTLDNVDPTSPGALSVSSTSTNSVVVNLPTNSTSTDTNFGSYSIYYKAGSSGVSTGDSSVTSIDDPNLANVNFNGSLTTSIGTGFTELATNTQYVADIYAADSYGNVASSTAEITFYTLSAVPTSSAATADSSSQITVTWEKAGAPTGTEYYVEDANDSSTNSGWVTSTSYSFTGLTASTAYSFKVKSRNGDGVETDYDVIVSATTSAASSGSNDNNNNNNSSSGGAIANPAPSTFVPPAPVVEMVDASDGDDQSPVNAGQVQARFTGRGQGVAFLVGGDTHRLQLDRVDGNRAFFTIFSDPIQFDLEEGSNTSIDLDADGEVDVAVQATAVDGSTGEAQVTVSVLESLLVSINKNAEETESRSVTVRVKNMDGVAHIAISEDNTFANVSFVPYTEYSSFTLSEGLGEKTVYVRLRKSNGAMATIEDSIVLTGESTTGCVLSVGKAYKSATSPAVYMVTNAHAADGSLTGGVCTRRAFQRSDVFFTYFDSWSDVVVDEKILDIEKDALGFMPWGPTYDPQYGALVKVVSDPKVYLLLGESKYWITSEDVFTELGYKWHWVEDIDAALLDSYATGSEITATDVHPNYTLVKYADSPRVYRLEPDPQDSGKTVKRYIPNEAIFESLQYRWDRIVTIPEEEQYEDGMEL